MLHSILANTPNTLLRTDIINAVIIMLAKKVSNNHSSKVVTLRIPTQAGNSQQSQSRSVQDDHQAVDIDSFESSQFQQDPDTLLVANSKPKSILTAILAGLTFSLSLIVAYTWMQKYISPAPTPAAGRS